MSNTEPQNKLEDKTSRAPQKPRRQRLRLPFDNRRQDAGEWAYDHRLGLSVMIIVYLVLGIVFVGSKIIIGSKPHEQGIYIDLQTLEDLEAEKERLEREIEQKQASDLDWSAIRNRTSHDAMLNEDLKDDRGTKTSELNASAKDIMAGMNANRAAYEAGLAEAQSILDADRGGDESEASDGQDSKVKGGVTVRFEFKDPVRTKRRLVVPAYMCDTGGQVVVSVTIDRGGEVLSAKVVSGGDELMRDAALKAARESLFNIDMSAPERHRGTITYTFLPQ